MSENRLIKNRYPINDPKFFDSIQPADLRLILGAECNHNERDITNIDLFAINDRIYIFNHYKGYLVEYDYEKDFQKVVNGKASLLDLTGFAMDSEHYYFCYNDALLIYDKELYDYEKIPLDFTPDSFTYDFKTKTFYFYIREKFRIYAVNIQNNLPQTLESYQIEGIGFKSFSISEGKLWHTDYTNHMIYCSDIQTGKTMLAIPSPYLRPTGICHINGKTVLSFEGRTFIHHKKRAKIETVVGERYRKPFLSELRYNVSENGNKKFVTSNKFLVEFIYTLECRVDYEDDIFENLFVRIALPYTNDRQKLIAVTPIGENFKIIDDNNIKMAEFRPGYIDCKTSMIIGYKALVEMSGIKYLIENKVFTKDMIDYNAPDIIQYLANDEDLDMDHSVVKEFAVIGDTTDIIETVYKIRQKVYNHLTYDYELVTSSSPAEVIQYGSTGCGGYAKLILACLRLNGIPARDSGKYSLQQETHAQVENETIIFNHSWTEFYLPTVGWIPLESSRDSFTFNSRNKENGWLGIDWTHLECLTNSNRNFEYAYEGKPENRVSLGGLLENNPSFRIIGEIID